MKLVDDNIYIETLKSVKKLLHFAKNPTKYDKKVLINLMPSFALKQLLVFTKLGEYLKKENIYVDYLICDGFFSHCDMIKMNDEVDRKLMCERCKKANNFLSLNSTCKVLDINNSININQKIDSNYENYFKNAIFRYCGDSIKFIEYEKEVKLNLLKSANIHMDNYDLLITLNHFQHYSIAPFINSLPKLILGLNEDKISIFPNEKDIIFSQKIYFDEKKLKKIYTYLKNRISIKNKLNIKTNRPIVSFFPNIFQDVIMTESVIFKDMLDWLKESVDFLLNKGFFVIIKAHPHEKKWNPIKSVIDYFKPQENLLLIPNNTIYTAYDIINISDYVVTFNGTIFFEANIMNKKVVLGNKIGKFYHKSKEEYFNQFFNYKPYGNINEILEYAYKLIFTNTFKLNMIDFQLKYPYIKDECTYEVSFKAIKDIILNKYDVNKYIDDFIPIY